MRALCLSKFSKGVREFAQVIKKDAAISVGRSEFRGVLRGVAERWSLATRRGLGCRHNRPGGDVGAPGCFLRRGRNACRPFFGRSCSDGSCRFAYCFRGGGCRRKGVRRQLHEQRIAADRDDRYPGKRHHAGSDLVDLVGGSLLCRLPLLMVRERQQMIISSTLLGIAENLVGTHDLAEFKSGIQVFRIDVGMDSLDRATERSPQLIGIVVRKRAEQIVKRLHGNALRVGSLYPPRTFRCKIPKGTSAVLSMILFQRGRKMTELCATRMELDYAFVEFRSFFARASPSFDSVVSLPIRLHIPDDRESRRGPLSVRCKNSKRRLAAKPSASITPSTYLSR